VNNLFGGQVQQKKSDYVWSSALVKGYSSSYLANQELTFPTNQHLPVTTKDDRVVTNPHIHHLNVASCADFGVSA
jgi:hypothetical protein